MPALIDLPRLSMTRRALVTAAGGLTLGIAATTGLAAADAYIRTPTLTIIGQDAAQFTMVHTKAAKIGLLFGSPGKELLTSITQVLGWTAPRLDVLAVSPAALTAVSRDWLARSTSLRLLLVLGTIVPSQMPAMRPGVPVTALTTPGTIALTGDLRVDLLPSFSIAETYGAAESVPALALVRSGTLTTAVADDIVAVQQHPWQGRLAMVVVPAGELRPLVATRRPAAIAINGGAFRADELIPRDLTPPGGRLTVLPTYLSDPATIPLGGDTLRLPGWARVVGPGNED